MDAIRLRGQLGIPGVGIKIDFFMKAHMIGKMSDFPDCVLDKHSDPDGINSYGRYLADLFGVSRYDEAGKPRQFGRFVKSGRATLWFILARSDWYITSYYHLTLLGTQCGMNIYIVHPLPNLYDSLYDRAVYPPQPVYANGVRNNYMCDGWTLYQANE